MKYIIKYILPDGSVVYHCDVFCMVSKNIEEAKRYTYDSFWTTEPAAQLAIVRGNFEQAWNDAECGSEYRGWLLWKGYSLEEIQTVTEIIVS